MVGVSNRINMTELQMIASDNDFIFSADEFEELVSHLRAIERV